MKCPACNGKIIGIIPSNGLDLQGTCQQCGAVQLADESERTVFAKKWCSCKDTTNQEIYFFTIVGGHGWLHTVCGQVT